MVYMYDCLDARHGVFRGHLHVGRAAEMCMIAFACSRGGGGVKVLFLHSRRLELPHTGTFIG